MNKIKINFVKGLGLASKSLSTNPAVTGTSLGMIEPPALKEAVSKMISRLYRNFYSIQDLKVPRQGCEQSS